MKEGLWKVNEDGERLLVATDNEMIRESVFEEYVSLSNIEPKEHDPATMVQEMLVMQFGNPVNDKDDFEDALNYMEQETRIPDEVIERATEDITTQV